MNLQPHWYLIVPAEQWISLQGHLWRWDRYWGDTSTVLGRKLLLLFPILEVVLCSKLERGWEALCIFSSLCWLGPFQAKVESGSLSLSPSHTQPFDLLFHLSHQAKHIIYLLTANTGHLCKWKALALPTARGLDTYLFTWGHCLGHHTSSATSFCPGCNRSCSCLCD